MIEISKCFELVLKYACELESKQCYQYTFVKIHTI